jgi:hypothetical protein
MPRNRRVWNASNGDAAVLIPNKNESSLTIPDAVLFKRARNRVQSAICLRQIPASFCKCNVRATRRRPCQLVALTSSVGPRSGRNLVSAIGLTNAALDRVAARAAIPRPPATADGTLIGLTNAALDGVAGRTAIPCSPTGPVTVAVAIAVPIGRRRGIVLRAGGHRASHRRSNKAREQENSGPSAHKLPSLLCHLAIYHNHLAVGCRGNSAATQLRDDQLFSGGKSRENTGCLRNAVGS